VLNSRQTPVHNKNRFNNKRGRYNNVALSEIPKITTKHKKINKLNNKPMKTLKTQETNKSILSNCIFSNKYLFELYTFRLLLDASEKEENNRSPANKNKTKLSWPLSKI